MYRPTSKEIWKGRIDAADGVAGLRWHQFIQLIDLQKEELPPASEKGKSAVLLGFASDEGVRRNQGRIGAEKGAEFIRKACASLPVHFSEDFRLFDLGDVACTDGQLEKAHQELADSVSMILKQGHRPFLWGGGHEIAYGHFKGLAQYLDSLAWERKPKIGIINFDAHFDLRTQTPETGPSSGTPFLQIANEWGAENFHYLCIGIQKYANTRILFDTAEKLGVEYVMGQEVMHQAQMVEQKIEKFIEKLDFVYLTICLDVFLAACAPGVSAPSHNGVLPSFIFPMLEKIARSGKLLSADIAEMNPAYDIDQRTARLAASITFTVLDAWK
jgi:formiminoglutamase